MRVITQQDELDALCARLSSLPFAAIDTEFMRDKSYWPRLCLIQAAGDGVEALIDPLAEGLDLSPFHRLLTSPDTIKAFHAARQDVEVFHSTAGIIPSPLFDTQIAAMACGYGDAVGYEGLVRALLGIRLDKSERVTDWARRPLRESQLRYALADVTHLRDVYRLLSERLDRTGRREWIVDAHNETLLDPSLYRLDPREAWRRARWKGRGGRGFGAFIELCAWREEEARRRDKPRGWILKDDVLQEIARRRPKSVEALEGVRGVPSELARSSKGDAILNALRRGEKASADSLPEPPASGTSRRVDGARFDLLKLALRTVCEREGVSSRLIASSSDLEDMLLSEDEPPPLRGWRDGVFGEAARALLRGEAAIGVADDGAPILLETPTEPRRRGAE